MKINDSLLIVFLHLERTGGSSVNSWFLSTQEFKEGVNYFEWKYNTSLNLSSESFVHPKMCYYGGHFSLADTLNLVEAWNFEKTLLITVLREPVARILSAFRLWLRSPEWFPDLQSIPKSFPDYYAATRDFYSLNLACRRIAGSQNASLAADILDRQFSIVGLTEDLESFRIRLAEHLDALVPELQFVLGPNKKSNQGLKLDEHEMVRFGMSSDMLEQIAFDNIEDQKLYNTIKKMQVRA